MSKLDNNITIHLRRLTIVLILMMHSFASQLSAQIFPPDLLCVRSDTLYWDVPNNTCGTFNSYSIFTSSNPTGPFSLLTTITNQAQTFYFDPNPSGITLYYYMQSDYNCPGQTVLSSDTLDNRSPEPIVIQNASVNGNNVELSWEPSQSPETSGYIVFRNTPLGTQIVDTVFNATSYVDVTAMPNGQPETYFVIAMDECGNTSIFDSPHTTIFVEETVDPCNQSIQLNWNLYGIWENGIDSQEIWLGLNSNPPTLVETLGSMDTSFVFENANNMNTYCFFVKAVAAVSGYSANSNQVCLTPVVIQPMENITLKNVTVLPDNTVALSWNWDADAEIQSVEILQSETNNNFSVINSTVATLPLNILSSEIDASNNPSQGKLFYQIQTTDLCDTLAFSNIGSTIHLTGIAQPNALNAINWTAFDIEDATILSYDIYRILGNDISFLGNVPPGTTQYSDVVDATDDEQSNACYYVEANATIELPNGNIEQIKSRSNITCVEQLASIVSPNAFAPNGRNQIFKPTVIFGETVDFNMKIFNRWGELLFESNDKDDGWNGKYKGKLMPMDTYVFVIRITQQNGRVVEDKGVLVLIR